MGTYKILFLIVAMLVAQGCAREQKVTETRLLLGNIAGMMNSDGGVLMVGDGPFGTFSKNLSDTNVTYTLATGQWRFRVVAWSGPNPLEGTLRCEDFQVTLTKSSESVALFLNEAKCAGIGFGGAAVRSGSTFKPLTVHTCVDLAQDINGVGINGFVPGMNCDDYRGRERSFRIGYPPKDTPGTAGHVTPPLGSVCITGMVDPSASIASNVRIPNLGPQVPVRVIAYDQPGCTGIERHFLFDQGLTTTSFLNDAFPFYGASVGDVYLDSMLCAGSWLTNVPFAQGAHEASEVNYICNALHLNSLSIGGGNYDVAHMTAASQYALAANIDLTGYTDSIGGVSSDAFKGTFDGRGRTLSNGTVGVFAFVGDGAEIFDLTLDNFYSTVGDDGLGFLINQISNVTSTSPVRIDSVTIKNSIHIDGGAFSGFGSLIGFSDWPVQLDRITIDNVIIDATSTSNTGLVVGNIDNGNDNFETRIRHIKVKDSLLEGENYAGGVVGFLTVSDTGGVLTYIDTIEVLNTVVTGLDGVGSIVGNATATAGGSLIMSDLFVQGPATGATLVGDTYTGGIIGFSDQYVNLEINDAYFEGALNMSTAGGDGFGGIVGDATIVRIFNSSAVVDMTDLSGGPIYAAGGIIGRMGGNSGTQATLINNYADVNFDFDQANGVGGLVGKAYGQPAFTNKNIVSNSMATGVIATTDTPTYSSDIGGLVGLMQNGTLELSISHVDLNGDQNIGGALGNGDSMVLSDIYVAGDVTFRQDADALQNGGVVGIMNASSGNNSTMSNLAFAGVITDYVCSVGDCAVIIGAIVEGGFAGSCSPNSLYGNVGAYTNLLNNGVGVEVAACDDGGDVTPTAVTSSTLNFTSQHAVLSPALNVPGTAHYPLIIDSVADWNSASNQPYLLNKNLALGAHLNFNAQTFMPFGGASVPPIAFKGKLIPQGYTLSNITLDADVRCGSDGSGHSHCGIFRQVGDSVVTGNMARVGYWDDPLIINGLTVEWDDSLSSGDRIGGVAGIVMNANIAARINNGLIVINNDNTARSGYGGLVGLLSDNGTIESSSYIGSITVNGDTQLHTGGLVGLVEMQNSSTYASILSSRAIVNISGSGVHRGGLVGGALLNNANNMLYVTDVYTKINGISGDTTSNGGLFGRLNRVPSGALQMHNAIAIFDTTNTADGVVGTVGAQPFPDDADNSIVVINMQGDHPNEGYAVSFGSWSQFLATPTNYDAIFNGNTHSELYHDPAFQFPRFVWEYPLGTYPNLP